MNKTFTVFKYELRNNIKSKTFIFSTLFFMIGLIALSIFFKVVVQNEMSNFDATNPDAIMEEVLGGQEKNIGFINENQGIEDSVFTSLFPGYKFTLEKDQNGLENKIKDGTYNSGLVLKDDKNIDIIYDKTPAIPTDTYIIQEGLKNFVINRDLEERGISLEEVRQVEANAVVNTNVISLGVNNTLTAPISMGISIVLYILIVMNGQVASMNVAREKNDRTMELLITSTDAKHLINGKVMASFVQSLISIVFIGIATVIAVAINWEFIKNMIQNIDITVDPTSIIIALLFFVFGYIMYLYIYAALGATVSNTEEINTAVGPVMIIVVAVYFSTIMALSNINNPENLLLKVLSYLPFSSMFTMHARYALTDISLMEVGISLGILIVTSIILSFLSVKLYRSSSLNYGNRNKFWNRFKRKKK